MCVARKKVRERGGCKWFADRVKAGRAKKRASESQRKKSNGFAHTPWLWTRARGGGGKTYTNRCCLANSAFILKVRHQSLSIWFTVFPEDITDIKDFCNWCRHLHCGNEKKSVCGAGDIGHD